MLWVLTASENGALQCNSRLAGSPWRRLPHAVYVGELPRNSIQTSLGLWCPSYLTYFFPSLQLLVSWLHLGVASSLALCTYV